MKQSKEWATTAEDSIERGAACSCRPTAVIDKGRNMRRKLISGIIGGLALHTIMPRDAVAAGSPAITEAMVLDFLQRLKEVVDHDDLGDRAFIERTLRVRFSISRGGEQVIPNLPDVKRAWRELSLVSDTDPLLQLQDPHRSHTLLDLEPTPQGPAERDLRLVFDPERFSVIGITEASLFQVFGQPLRSVDMHAKKSNKPSEGFTHRSHGYRYDRKNSTVVVADLNGVPGYVNSIHVYENVVRLKDFGR